MYRMQRNSFHTPTRILFTSILVHFFCMKSADGTYQWRESSLVNIHYISYKCLIDRLKYQWTTWELNKCVHVSRSFKPGIYKSPRFRKGPQLENVYKTNGRCCKQKYKIPGKNSKIKITVCYTKLHYDIIWSMHLHRTQSIIILSDYSISSSLVLKRTSRNVRTEH